MSNIIAELMIGAKCCLTIAVSVPRSVKIIFKCYNTTPGLLRGISNSYSYCISKFPSSIAIRPSACVASCPMTCRMDKEDASFALVLSVVDTGLFVH